MDLHSSRELGPLERLPAAIAVLALMLMLLIPVIELIARPFRGGLIVNAPLLTQHFGLVLSMMGAIAAFPAGHLSTLTGSASLISTKGWSRVSTAHYAVSMALAALCALLLCISSFELVQTELEASHPLAYGLEVWMLQAIMPLGYAVLALTLMMAALRTIQKKITNLAYVPLLGVFFALQHFGFINVLQSLELGSYLILACLMAIGGSPIFAVIGVMTVGLFVSIDQPLTSIPLSQYSMTVNPSLPALPLYTLAGLLFARSSAAQRLSDLISMIFGGGWRASVLASALLCSAFTALTGGSGVTLLALGGILLPMLQARAYPEQQGIGLITSASALGVLLAPSVPLIMYAILAKVPIQTMLLAGLLPAIVMVISLLSIGGFMRRNQPSPTAHPSRSAHPLQSIYPSQSAHPSQTVHASLAFRGGEALHRGIAVLGQAAWELLAVPVALLPLISGLATPTESAALTALYALVVVSLIRRELQWQALWQCFLLTAQLIGAVMLILGMALGLTNFLVDAGVPDQAIDWVKSYIQDPETFLLAAVVFIALAGALMEIYAALVVLVPLMLPLALSYDIHPVHFGIVFLATLEMGFLCPPAGMNLYFASAVFRKPLRRIMTSVLPALLSIFAGSAVIALVPALSLALPRWLDKL